MSGTILEPGQIEASASKPPFFQQPPRDLFALRAARLETLAQNHPLAAYLTLAAAICRAQQAVLDAPPDIPPPNAHRIRESLVHGLPPLAADTLVRDDGWPVFLDALLRAFIPPVANPALDGALDHLRKAGSSQRKAWGVALVSGQYDLLPAALVPFIGAGLQTAWSHWLLGLDLGELREREDQAYCPCCGAPPMAGVIRHRGQVNGLRYLVCSLCSGEWHYVRLKCSHCQSTKRLDYLHLDDSPHGVRAEACPSCKTYLKQLYLEHAPDGECLSADLASLDLDLLLAEQGYLRRAPNLLLAPGGEG